MEESTVSASTVIDELYEFSAPCFFDFVEGESEDEARTAELWFKAALAYAPSPFMARIKAGSRSVNVESLCNFSEEDQIQKALESSDATTPNSNLEDKTRAELVVPDKVKEVVKPSEAMVETNRIATEIANNDDKDKENTVCAKENGKHCWIFSVQTEKTHLNIPTDEEKDKSAVLVETEASTPKPLTISQKKPVSDKKHQTAKKIAGTPNLALENQAIKRQKLDGGRSRQILNVKPHNLPHKSKLGLTNGSSNLSSSTAKTVSKLDRKVYVREQSAPFVSMAEMMKKFQSSTRDLSLPPSSSSNDNVQMPPLKLTRPKEPELETARRTRSVRVKSTAELEEEMMAKIPKLKARPLNKKIFEAPPLPSIPKSTPKPPEFQEFHLETMARASKNAETSSVASTEMSHQVRWKPHLAEPKTPVLQTSLRARPTKVKSTIELEQEELKKAPKFKARPLNKKIFESKGELGIFCNAKKQVTIPQEFHFATHERIPPPPAVFDLFDKLSLNFESSHDPIPRKTIPNPFHLHTEERGAEKEKKFVMEVIEKQFEEERARVPKANPYPYTTDYPVIPPKPESKQCTKPEPFQLESLVRHEEEMKREMEERKKKEKEEAQMRVFKAQPVLKEDPIPVPEKARKPLTQIKVKEMTYKRYREESEAARMIEEEKALKQLRRTMVPHARPLPKFDHPFCPQKSCKETTNPKSPRLRVLQRMERKKRIGSLTAPTSSPTTLMSLASTPTSHSFTSTAPASVASYHKHHRTSSSSTSATTDSLACSGPLSSPSRPSNISSYATTSSKGRCCLNSSLGISTPYSQQQPVLQRDIPPSFVASMTGVAFDDHRNCLPEKPMQRSDIACSTNEFSLKNLPKLKMGKPEVKGTVTPLSSMFPPEEVQKAAKLVEEKLSEKRNEMSQLKEFIADNTSLINLVQKLPDELHHDIMVPFGKAAFFPGRLIHTNEFLVLLGESYYADRTAKQTVDILKRRGKSLMSKVDALKAEMQDLKAEASFFDSTASEVAEDLVEIREYEEDNSNQSESQSGPTELESPTLAETDHKMDSKMGASKDDEYARLMSRLEELEKEELAAENGEIDEDEDEDEDEDANATETDGDENELTEAAFHRKKDEGYSSLDHGQRFSESQPTRQLQQSKGKEAMREEISNKYNHQDLTNQFSCTGLTAEPLTKGEMSCGRIIHQDKMLNPSVNASVPSENKPVQTSKSKFDSSKAFTGSIVEHTENLEKKTPGQNTTPSESSGSKPSKPVSRFKMQRK
ncbi:hypothetical protein V6N13_050086 [Hibiscus sabdariffa]